jgi:hypothetical protein
MELAISIAVAVLLAEAYVWLPKISEWLIEHAVSKLQAEDQARCREEWKAGLAVLPNSGVKLLHALSFSFAAKSINGDSMEAKLEQVSYEVEVLSVQHARTLQEMHTVKTKVAENQALRKRLARTVDESVASLRAIEVPTSLVAGNGDSVRNAREVVNAYNNAVNEVEKLDRLVVVAVNRASEITESRVNRLVAKIAQIDIQIRRVRTAHAGAKELLRNRKWVQLPPVLKNLDDEFQTLRGMEVDEVDDGEHAVTKQEYERIMTALQNIAASHSEKKACG